MRQLQPVWPLPLRLFHWVLAALVLFNFFNDGDRVHRWAGYAAAGLMLLRLLWGLRAAPGSPVRLGLPSAGAIKAHARAMLRRQVPSSPGHNPVGLAMVWLLAVLVLALGLSGWVGQWDRYWGEEWIETLHEILALALQVCVVLHLLGVALSSWLERQNLALGMLIGRKQVDVPPPGSEPPRADGL